MSNLSFLLPNAPAIAPQHGRWPPYCRRTQKWYLLFNLGETFNGHLVNCDSWMNINLREVIITSADATRFFKASEMYIKGSTIKHLRIPDQVIDLVRKDQASNRNFNKVGGHRGVNKNTRGGRNVVYY